MPKRNSKNDRKKKGRAKRKAPLTKAQVSAVKRLATQQVIKEAEWRKFNTGYGNLLIHPAMGPSTEAETGTAINKYGAFKKLGFLTKQLGPAAGPYSGEPSVRMGDQVTLRTIHLTGEVTANVSVTSLGGNLWEDNVLYEKQFAKLFMIRIPNATLSQMAGSLTVFWEDVMQSLPMPQTIKSNLGDSVHEAIKAREILWSAPVHFKKKYYSMFISNTGTQFARAETVRINKVIKKRMVLNYPDVNTNQAQEPVEFSYFLCARWGNFYERRFGEASIANCPNLQIIPLAYYQDI